MVIRIPFVVLCFLMGAAIAADPRVLTLKQAVEIAERQNPDLILARLDAQKAELGVDAVREPWIPRVNLGSGLAYTYGYPLSIEGSAPSIIDVAATRSILNRQRSYQVQQAKETSRGAALSAEAAREEMALRVAVLFLDLEKAARAKDLAARQADHLRRVEATVRLRVDEGRELPIESRRAALNVRKAVQRGESADALYQDAQRALALALGLEVSTPIVPAMEERSLIAPPANEDASVATALKESPDLKRLESSIVAKGLEAKSYRASRLPTINFVAKYGLFGRYNNFEDYFLRFQRNNALVGASFNLPLFSNNSEMAQAAQADVEANRLKVQLSSQRSRIESETRTSWQRVREADGVREVARMDLEVARESVTLLLAQQAEGRASMKQLEEARFAENERWLALYEAQYAAERARFELLRRTESLLAALR